MLRVTIMRASMDHEVVDVLAYADIRRVHGWRRCRSSEVRVFDGRGELETTAFLNTDGRDDASVWAVVAHSLSSVLLGGEEILSAAAEAARQCELT
ncbi:hypothetical protein QCE49_12560 [Caballeronia sp. LZ008]|uniref:hypothetical protein n=1 Tax=unclassified Caballeronia TaxID=2646786 RepID=UPI002028A156|nr:MULTISPECIES: hypothetical protein [unclassified Caballeronia]MDR5794204.1 hypothetical protein [Caballeronia sp. LZ008]